MNNKETEEGLNFALQLHVHNRQQGYVSSGKRRYINADIVPNHYYYYYNVCHTHIEVTPFLQNALFKIKVRVVDLFLILEGMIL